MKVGLTLGKFAPLHSGHQLVIETALAEMEHLVVVIYQASKVTLVPLSVRANWIRELYPGVEVIEAATGPEETGYTPEIIRAQESFLTTLLGGRRITAFYSSEPYGEHVSRALGCLDRRVDPDRVQCPVSATEIRGNLFANLDQLHPRVRADLLPRIVLLGGPSTGKSTLAEGLAAELNEPLCEEFGRQYWFDHQKEHRLSMEDLETIACEQMRLENQTARRASRYVIADTSPLTTLVYARYYFGEASAELERIVQAYRHSEQLLFLCDTDIPFDDSWDRSGPGSRDEIQELTIAELENRKFHYTLVSGDPAQRVSTVRKTIRKWRSRC